MEGSTIQRLLAKLRQLRLGRGWTQEEFSEKSGISYKYYQAVEAGRKLDLRLSTLERLAKAHQLEVWQLLLPGEDEAPAPSARARKQSARRKK
ncbi:helix-turn-helix transcriptional regulator [Verrucomicrobium sp. BvORR106]|jgi:transcriptional regulator with XRE-family HTH domain|uniref:helix-turn-helix domain-containing protein n=1 Tax=Verrucomicrobium sp. BvORR106 TaxID=1403819 RepID=UPI00068BE1D3|nr:helix-turn-helix transcriptional regulator [Verrucomicrobium sp. BvORR106]